MEPDGSLPQSQVPATVPILSQLDPAHNPHPTSWRSILILSSHRLGLRSGLFPSGFPFKTLYTPLFSPIRATCPAHLIVPDCITRTITGEEYRSLSSSLCSFLHSSMCVLILHITEAADSVWAGSSLRGSLFFLYSLVYLSYTSWGESINVRFGRVRSRWVESNQAKSGPVDLNRDQSNFSRVKSIWVKSRV